MSDTKTLDIYLAQPYSQSAFVIVVPYTFLLWHGTLRTFNGISTFSVGLRNPISVCKCKCFVRVVVIQVVFIGRPIEIFELEGARRKSNKNRCWFGTTVCIIMCTLETHHYMITATSALLRVFTRFLFTILFSGINVLC